MSLVSSTSNTWWFYRLQIICDSSNVWTKQKQLILNMKPEHEMFLKLYQIFSRNIKTLNSINIEIYINLHIVWPAETARIRQWFWLFHRSHNNKMWKIFEYWVENIWVVCAGWLRARDWLVSPDLKLLWVRCPGCSLHPPAASHHTWPPSTRGSCLDTWLLSGHVAPVRTRVSLYVFWVVRWEISNN